MHENDPGLTNDAEDPFEQWDITSSVGFTALMVAAGRAVETRQAHGLISDPHAELFVENSGLLPPLPTRPGRPWPVTGGGRHHAEEIDAFWVALAHYQGIRTRFLDTTVTEACRRGIRQVVLLAAGLDTRALRLSWPGGTVLYEIDQPDVIAYKRAVLAEHDVQPRCDRRTVAVDLRRDWAGALRANGFDPHARTAWLAEGLLPFLPATAQSALLTTVTDLSAAGSSFALEHFAPLLQSMRDSPVLAEFGAPYGIRLAELVDLSPRPDPARHLAGLGWTVSLHPAAQLSHEYDQPSARALPASFTSVLVHADRPRDQG